jgi:putative heme-binding domain-containing protein
LEAVLFPSQRIEQGFDPVRILTVDGRILNGIVLARSGSEISLRISADKVETIALSEIEEQRPSDVSIMPAGMLELLSLQEIADLLSLLEAAK